MPPTARRWHPNQAVNAYANPTGPAWLRWYPIFPHVLFLLTGAPRTRLTDRISNLQAMTTQHPSTTVHPQHCGHPHGGEPRSWTEL